MALSAGSFAFQSKEKKQYLRYNSEAGPRFQYVKSSLDDVRSPNIKFEVEKATGGDGSYVHIRSSYNNKYLRRLDDGSQHWIVAVAEKKEEDTSKWSCTLFQPIKVESDDDHIFIRLRHVQLGHYTQLYTSSGDYEGCMVVANSPTPVDGLDDVYRVYNWNSLVILPQYVAFKGSNGKYLRCIHHAKGNYHSLYFTSSDIGEDGVTHEVFPTCDGDVVRLKTYPKKLLWLYQGAIEPPENLLVVEEITPTPPYEFESDPAMVSRMLFHPVKVDDTAIALKSCCMNRFCQIQDERLGDRRGLAPEASSITEREKLTLIEPVMKRTMTITYRLDDSRTYDVVPIAKTTFEHFNHDTNPITKTVTHKFKKEVTSTWDVTNSCKIGMELSITVDEIPFIAETSVKLSAEFEATYAMGKTTTQTKEWEETATYTVPGMKKLEVKTIGTEGRCDVPYSYTQTDHLYNGKIIETTKSDGIFKGTYHFTHTTHHYIVDFS